MPAPRSAPFYLARRWREAGLALFALALSWGFILASGFDGLYGQDAFGYYDYAVQIWERLRRFQPPPSNNYWPAGYSALVAAVFFITGPAPLAGQIISGLAGAGTAALICALAVDLLALEGAPPAAARWVGIVAGLLTIACGQLWQWSVSVMADTLALSLAVFAAWSLVRYSRAPRGRWLLLAALGLGLAIITRWIYALLVLPFGAYWLLEVMRRTPESRAAFVRHALIAAALGALIIAPQLALSAGSPRATIGPNWVVGWSPLNAARREFVTSDGYAVYEQPAALFYARAAASPRYLFPMFTPFLLLGAWVVWRQRYWRVGVLLAGWAGMAYLFLCGLPYQNFRYALAFLPAVAILSGIGLRYAWERLPGLWRTLMVAYVVVGLGGGLWYSARVLDEFAARKQADLAVVRWVEQQARPGDLVLSFDITLTLQHYSSLDVRELFIQTPDDLGALVAGGKPTYLLVTVDDLSRQWRGYPPELNYRWLRDGPGLIELGRMGEYTLFRVGG